MFSLKNSTSNVFPENLEILYSSYGHAEILGIFKFLLKKKKKKLIKSHF